VAVKLQLRAWCGRKGGRRGGGAVACVTSAVVGAACAGTALDAERQRYEEQ